MLKIKIFTLVFLLIQFISCDNESIPGDTVYVAGVEVVNEKTIATYWINNRKISLTNGEYSSNAASIFVVGKDVYVAGYEINENGEPIAKYWKNGTEKILSNNWSIATSITVSEANIYVAGYERVGGGTKSIALYWKNGDIFELTDGTSDNFTSSIKVVGDDVYVTGGENKGNLVAKYWKNGNQVILFDNAEGYAYANSIDVTDNDIYVAGKEADLSGIPRAKYWRNGTSINLTNGETNASANSITVVDGEIYIAGYEANSIGSSIVKYWKNGTSVELPTTSLTNFATSIKVVGADVYVSGEEGIYWKNKTQTRLRPKSKTFLARDIFIIAQ